MSETKNPVFGNKPSNDSNCAYWEEWVSGFPILTLSPLVEKPNQSRFVILYGDSTEKNQRHRIKILGEDIVRSGHIVHCPEYRSNLDPSHISEFGLYDRLQDGRNAISWALRRKQSEEALVLVGISMGGYLSVRLADEFGDRIQTLILLAPTAYPNGVCRSCVKFGAGNEFQKIIRRKIGPVWFSWILNKINPPWANSFIFERAKEVKADVLLISYSHDKIVPRGVIKKYLRAFSLRPTGRFKFINLPGFDHSGTVSNKTKRFYVVNQILDFINN